MSDKSDQKYSDKGDQKPNEENSDDVSDLDELSEETIDKEAQQVQISKQFQEYVVKFVKLDDLIRKKQNEITELKSQRKPCETYILKYLDEINENVIDITNGKLRKNKAETKVPLSQEIIKHAIIQKVKDPTMVEEIIKLMDKRPTSVRVNLKRTSAREKRLKKVVVINEEKSNKVPNDLKNNNT